jgi:hypothetical protein
MKSLLRVLLSRGVAQKGLRGGSPIWLAIGALQLLRRFYSRSGKRSETVTLSERVRPGDELIIRYPGKAGRKTKKEIAATQKSRTAAQVARQREIDRLEQRRAAGGRKGRKATRALAEIENRTV